MQKIQFFPQQPNQTGGLTTKTRRFSLGQIVIATIAPLAAFSAVGFTGNLIRPVSAQVQQEQNMRTLTVTGIGDRPVQTTKAQISLGIEITAPTAGQVQTEIARRSNALVDKLRELNVEKLQTQNINLNANYVFENNRRRQEGFTGSSTVSFMVPVDRAGEALDESVSAGANRIERITFAATPTAIAAARDLALQDAVEDAQSQADVVLDRLGFTAKTIRTVAIGNPNVPRPIPLNNARLAVSESLQADPTPVIGGEQRVRATVTLEIVY
ncbi:protein of unknown function DUF541 [Thalassoporum mexicanum PCC 7367]|uniref:SIMPL domain-containing protein n=1 Tax=Thalassoporum mexicanum TaxID=3457544 RepID=UPI00029F8AF0|nr:SIMPL domain-containing protein [Pseudanabaena sp. PCC 7367]AFY71474.1 protein of unknown function DUF541 [Pseudanabaena sp. PCC 7367]